MIEVITFKLPDDMAHELFLRIMIKTIPTISTLYLLEMIFTDQRYLSNRKMQ